MKRSTIWIAATAIAVGLVLPSCGSPDESADSAPANGDLQSLLTAPANTQRTDGRDAIHDSGVHKHFLVNGSPIDVMNSYKSALESNGWTVTVADSGGGRGGGGATLTGTHGSTYGVFAGGGYGNTTDVKACAWPSKPASTNCGDRD